jgi:hypothetical protein
MKLNEFDFRHPSALAERRLGQGEEEAISVSLNCVLSAARELSDFYDIAQEIEECPDRESRHSSSGSAAR